MLHDPAAEADRRKRFRAPDEVLRADAVFRVPATWTPPTSHHGWHIFPLQDQAFAFAGNLSLASSRTGPAEW